jgi:hypothetical protein
MTSRVRLGCVAAVAVAAVVGLPGCSHDTVTSSTAGLAVTFLPSPSGSGRFEQGSMGITSVNFVPVDPALAALTPGNDLTLGAGITADLTLSTPKTLSHVALAPGTYKVTQIKIVPPRLVDEVPDTASPVCIDRLVSVPSGPAFDQVPAEYVIDESDGFQFTVRPGQTKLNIRVDVPAMLAGYESAFTCQFDCGSGTPCLTAFDAPTFRTVLLNTVSIE